MKKFINKNVLALVCAASVVLVAVVAFAGPVPNSWYRSGNVDVQGIIYAGSADTQLTNADGTLSAAAIASSCVNLTTLQTAAGAKTWSSAATFSSTIHGVGAATFDSTGTITGAALMSSTAHIVGAATLDSTLAVGAITTSGLFKYNSITGTISAHAGGGQGSATALTTGINEVTTVSSAADSVKLPAAAVGLHVLVVNSAASNTLSLFPASTEVINGGSASAAVSVLAKGVADCYAITTGRWGCQVSGAAVFP